MGGWCFHQWLCQWLCTNVGTNVTCLWCTNRISLFLRLAYMQLVIFPSTTRQTSHDRCSLQFISPGQFLLFSCGFPCPIQSCFAPYSCGVQWFLCILYSYARMKLNYAPQNNRNWPGSGPMHETITHIVSHHNTPDDQQKHSTCAASRSACSWIHQELLLSKKSGKRRELWRRRRIWPMPPKAPYAPTDPYSAWFLCDATCTHNPACKKHGYKYDATTFNLFWIGMSVRYITLKCMTHTCSFTLYSSENVCFAHANLAPCLRHIVSGSQSLRDAFFVTWI